MQEFLLEAPVGVSGRHVHLTKEHLQALFGPGYELTKVRDLGQPGEFAAKETVTVVGPKGVLEKVRIIGPLRSYSQVELSRTDCFKLGVNPPVRDSGDHEDSPGCVLVGPAGVVTLNRGVIIALRHIHIHTNDARRYGLKDKDMVNVQVGGERGLIFQNVLVRVHPNYRLEFHVDTDEANACLLNNDDIVQVLAPAAEKVLTMAG
ncbi:Propanediol utilisation protein [Moorella glycerini]|uniref:Phosphate propanoyltransferase n=1 Tax=Neomoorella stamsii TaxID=1266720 RepID=A0A9X7P5C9_9FIRM|nr:MULTISPECIES: phosphate propanoyltransferase [Moorella]PRR71383.1 Phosphate propanoyltransferase [Moorella stamsii]CEP66630.1 Propanediol utilisation protein [Moorella glycerini]CEP68592.1 Propanediol utilisation protein [Moorella glycerini]